MGNEAVQALKLVLSLVCSLKNLCCSDSNVKSIIYCQFTATGVLIQFYDRYTYWNFRLIGFLFNGGLTSKFQLVGS